MGKQDKYVNTNFVRGDQYDDQPDVYQKIIEEGHCPFCPENLNKYHNEPVLKDGKYWLLTTNRWPYEGMRHHFMAIYKEHTEKLAELDPESGKELLEMLAWLESEHKIPGGSYFMRFGDTAYTGSSVNHLHFQMISGGKDKLDGSNKKKVKLAFKTQ